MNYPKSVAAAKKVQRSEWGLADALLDEVGPRGSEVRFDECRTELADEGIDYSVRYLAALHGVARAFPPASRDAWLTPKLAQSAGSPKIVDKAVEMADEEGVDVTKRYLEKVRRAETHHVRKATGKRRPPARDVGRVTKDRPVSETRRQVDVLRLFRYTGDSAKAGRSFVGDIAGRDLTAEEREDLLVEVDKVLDTWKAAKSAVRNPLADSVEAFLDAQ